MNYIFYSYYIELLLKGKLKAIQISLAAILALLVTSLKAEGIIDFVTARSNDGISLLFLVLFIYSLMNLGYSVFSRYAPLPLASGTKEKIKDDSFAQKNEVQSEKSKAGNKLILQNKSYGSGIKSSPKASEINTKEIIKNVKTQQMKSPKEEIPPALEINIESTQEFFQDEKEETEVYSGIINEYTTDIIDFFETPPPGTKNAF